MMNCNDLTFIVTARERRNTLPRVMEYYKNLPCRIMLLDGSSERWDSADLYDHVEYFHLPNMPWMQKMVYGLKRVTTPYTLKMCDDDLVFLHAIPIMIDFLKNNPDYETVMGQEISVWDDKFLYETFPYLLEVNMEDNIDDLIQRMEFYWTYFNCKIHSIAKTKTQLEVYQFLLDNPDLYAVRFFDKIWALIVASRGKLKVLPILSHMRSRETKSGNVALGKNLESETKRHLSFKDDFLNRDLTKLQKFVGIDDVQLIKDAHRHLCSEDKKQEAFSKILKDIPLKTPDICIASQWGRPLPRAKPNEGYDWNEIDRIGTSATTPSEVYPVYKEESIKAISEMFLVFEKYPL